MHSGMLRATSSATTDSCSSNTQYQMPDKGRLGNWAPSIQHPRKSSPRGLPTIFQSSNNPQQHRSPNWDFQSDSDLKDLHKPKKLAKLKRYQAASNILDKTSWDSFRKRRSSRAVERMHRPRSPSVTHDSTHSQPRRGPGKGLQSELVSKVLYKVGPTKLAKLKRHQSASDVPDPTNNDFFRRRGSRSAFEVLHKPRSQSLSCGSAFDAQAIASNMRLWGTGLAAKNTKLSNRKTKHRSKSLTAESYKTFYPSSFIYTARATTMIKCCLRGLFGSLYRCISPVVLPITNFIALCISSDPPWAAPSDDESPVSRRAVRRRPSTEDTCQWAFEALTFEYDLTL